jgi:hypothetical protein
MSTKQMSADFTPDILLEAVKELSLPELENFADQVMLIRAQRKTPHLSRSESELLRKINRGLPEPMWQRYKRLVTLRDAELLTEEEHQELIRLSDKIEVLNAERIGYLLELAQLRHQSLSDLMNDLGIHPLDHG